MPQEIANKHTALRAEKILALLAASERPLGAYDLARMAGDEGKPLAPMKIYRSLEALLSAGLIKRVESRNAYIAVNPTANSGHPLALLVCSCCGKVEQKPAIIAPLLEDVAGAGFKPSTLVMEILGSCGPCSNGEPE